MQGVKVDGSPGHDVLGEQQSTGLVLDASYQRHRTPFFSLDKWANRTIQSISLCFGPTALPQNTVYFCSCSQSSCCLRLFVGLSCGPFNGISMVQFLSRGIHFTHLHQKMEDETLPKQGSSSWHGDLKFHTNQPWFSSWPYYGLILMSWGKVKSETKSLWNKQENEVEKEKDTMRSRNWPDIKTCLKKTLDFVGMRLVSH